VVVFAVAQALTFALAAEDGGAPAPSAEAEPELPAMPAADGLIDLYVSATSSNRFFIDPASVSVGADGTVRYVVTVRSSSGATSTNFEGMRCETHERRLYAFGRPDNSWSRARNSGWSRISNAGPNRYAYTLMREYFCPGGIAIRSAAEGVDALRRGGHPAAQTGS
jgi:hypothetical protein